MAARTPEEIRLPDGLLPVPETLLRTQDGEPELHEAPPEAGSAAERVALGVYAFTHRKTKQQLREEYDRTIASVSRLLRDDLTAYLKALETGAASERLTVRLKGTLERLGDIAAKWSPAPTLDPDYSRLLTPAVYRVTERLETMNGFAPRTEKPDADDRERLVDALDRQVRVYLGCLDE